MARRHCGRLRDGRPARVVLPRLLRGPHALIVRGGGDGSALGGGVDRAGDGGEIAARRKALAAGDRRGFAGGGRRVRAARAAGVTMDLHTSGHRRGVVCAPHAAAVEDGRAVLAEGGNAIEAMIAMAASIAAAYPHMNHIGGDAFWLIREPSGRVRALMGAGPAGAKATLNFYREHGCDEIPPRGPLAALTVPGALATWQLALEAAQSFGGKIPRDVLLGAAIRRAREGYTVTRSQARL